MEAAQLPKDVLIVTTADAARKLGRLGFTAAVAIDTWEQVEVSRPGASLTITGVPAKHALQPLEALLPPVNDSILDRRPSPPNSNVHSPSSETPQRALTTPDGALELIDADATMQSGEHVSQSTTPHLSIHASTIFRPRLGRESL